MNRRILILIIIAVATILLCVGMVAWLVTSRYPTAKIAVDNQHRTAGATYFEDNLPPADERFVGCWQNIANPLWHKAYYDDYDTDGFYWGKEWNEAEDVQETDLVFHGNGWFRWKVENGFLHERHMQDQSKVQIGKVYVFELKKNILHLTDNTCPKSTYQFQRD